MKVFAVIAIAALALVGCSSDDPPAVEEVTESTGLTESIFKDAARDYLESMPTEDREHVCVLTDFDPAGLEAQVRADYGSNTVAADWNMEVIYEVCG